VAGLGVRWIGSLPQDLLHGLSFRKFIDQIVNIVDLLQFNRCSNSRRLLKPGSAWRKEVPKLVL